MTPVYFKECFGWLHWARGGCGVVICPAYGVEELCTHRFMRHLAEQLSAAGMPVLRFDYHGTGNSKGSDQDPDRVVHWLTSIKQAIACLKKETGVSEVALVGLRLGALLAAEVAQQSDEIEKLVLLAPVSSGKSYVRETRALAMVMDTERVAGNLDARSAGKSDGMEVAGFQLSAATIESMQKLEFPLLSKVRAQNVLIMGRPNVAADALMADKLRSSDCMVTHMEFRGFAEMQWDTSFASLPHDAFDPVVHWLVRNESPANCAQSVSISPARLEGDGWIEEAVQFGESQRLFGVLCQSDQSNLNKSYNQVVLFINHGANHHVGWARMHVMLGRRFARRSVDSLRMDISGVGDSPARPGYEENMLYARHSQYDVYAAIDWLVERGYQTITIVGHCAGAHLGFYTTLYDARVKGLVMLNMQRFFWVRGASLAVASRNGFRSSNWYQSRVFDPQVWRRLVAGEVNLGGIIVAMAKRVMARLKGFTEYFVAPVLGKESKSRKVVRWFRELSERGTRVLLVYSYDDAGLDEIAVHAGLHANRLTKLPNVKFHMLDGADHNLTPAWTREKYADLLEEFLTDEGGITAK